MKTKEVIGQVRYKVVDKYKAVEVIKISQGLNISQSIIQFTIWNWKDKIEGLEQPHTYEDEDIHLIWQEARRT